MSFLRRVGITNVAQWGGCPDLKAVCFRILGETVHCLLVPCGMGLSSEGTEQAHTRGQHRATDSFLPKTQDDRSDLQVQ